MGYKNGMIYMWAGDQNNLYRLNTSNPNLYNISDDSIWENVLSLSSYGYGGISHSSVVVIRDYMFNMVDRDGLEVFRINLVFENGTDGLSVTGEPSLTGGGISKLFHTNAVFIPYLQEIWVLGGTPSGLSSRQDTIYKSTIIWPTNAPTVLPSEFPSTEPSRIPSQLPTTIPSTIPNGQPTFTPSIIPSGDPTKVPSTFPSSQPSFLPSIEPSMIPTQYPTFVENDYNFSAIATILLNCHDFDECKSSTINGSLQLQKDIIYSFKVGSEKVRYDLKSINDIDIEILGIYSYNNKTLNTTTTRMVFEIAFASDSDREGWVIDVNDILDEFTIELIEKWGNNTVVSIELQTLTITEAHSTTSTTTFTTSTTTALNSTNEPYTSIVSTILAAAENQDEELLIFGHLGTISNYTLVAVCIVAFAVCVIGWIDAQRRHNEIFKLSTMIVVIMYFMDVVSGLSFVDCFGFCFFCVVVRCK